MKKCTLVVGLLLCLALNPLSAQGLEEKVEQALSTLDYSEAGTGILYEKIPTYLPFDYFGGSYYSDSTSLITTRYLLLYGMLDKAHTTASNMLPVADFWALADSLGQADTIELSALYYRYNRFKPYAIDSNLVVYQDSQFYDVAGRTESPYFEDTLYAASLLRNVVDTTDLVFRLRPDLLLSNMPGGIQVLQADFDDGNGWQALTPDQSRNIHYPDTGLYRIRIRALPASGDTLRAQSLLRVDAPAAQMLLLPGGREYADEPDGYKFFPSGQDSTDGVDVHWWYGECPGEIRKPLILLKGFDPNNDFNYQILFDPEKGLLTNPYGDPNNIQLEEKLYDEGYDIFFISPRNSTDTIQNNARRFQEVIDSINVWKARSGSTEQNIVIGASAGGLIGKWGLREMELQGRDHDTELFITLDSPLKGANIPLGMQVLLDHMGNYQLLGFISLKDIVRELGDGLDALNSPAARQMLYYHQSAHPYWNSTTADLSVWHDAFYTEFEALGDLDIPHVAIANGAQNGTGQLFGAQTLLLQYDDVLATYLDGILFDVFSNILTPFAGSIHQISLVKALPDSHSGSVYTGSLTHYVTVVPIISDKAKNITDNLIKPYDSAPGGMRGFSGENSSITLPWNYPSFCFIPTISALDLDVTDPYFDASDEGQQTGNGTTSLRSYTGAIEPSIQYEINQVNQQHVTLNRRAATFLLYYLLDIAAPDSLLDNATYNFGETDAHVSYDTTGFQFRRTDGVIDKDLTITGNGQLWVNRDDRIAFTHDPNPDNTAQSHFLAHILQSCEDSTRVEVLGTGRFLVGEYDNGVENTATLNIGDSSTLYLHGGGLLQADKYSQIIVRRGGHLHVDSAGHLRIIKGELIVKDGGRLTIEQDAFIEPWYSEGTIHIEGGGELVINGQFDFNGSGFFQFDQDNILSLHTPFMLTGKGRGSRFMRLNKYATLHIDHHGIFLEDGRVDYEDYGRILQGPGGMARFVHTDFKGLGQDNSIALETDDAEQVFVFQCTFYDLDRGLQLRNMGPGQTASVQYSNFTNNLGAIAAENVDRITLTECDIDAGATGIAGLDLFDVGDMALVNTDVHHFPYTSGAIRLVNTKRFRMFGGEVADNQLGLLAPAGSGDPNESNVFLYQQATFRHNQIGISMPNGGFDRGLVLMDCAVMWENFDIAIEGVDVELQIDACQNAGDPTCTNIRPNVFKPYGGSLYFDICYRERDDDGIIPAKGNYWDATPAAGAPHGNYYIRESFIPDTTQMNPDCGPLLLLDYSFRVPNLPAGCSYAPDPEDPENPENPENPTIPKDQCFVDDGSEQVVVHDQYNQAYEVFRDTIGNPDGFVPIAGISNTIRDTSTYVCRHYIDVARAIVDASAPPATEIDIDEAASLAALEWESGVLRKLESRQYGKVEPASSRMLLYPNPVREELTVTAGPGRYELRVYDLLGRLEHSRRMDGNSKLNVKGWLSGVYMVQLTDLSSFEVQQGRFVVR